MDAGQQQPVWSDKRIEAVINHQEVVYHQSEPSVPFTRLWSMSYMLTLMRDEYEARLRSVEQRLERVLDRCLEHSARVEQLEAALADLPQGEG